MWVDGYHDGDHVWRTQAFREHDSNQDPAKIEDLSIKRAWHKQPTSTEYEVFSPKPGKSIVFNSLPDGFCTNTSESPSRLKFYISGVWSPQKMALIPPKVQFVINKRNIPFSWSFRLGEQNTSHFMDNWGETNKRIKLLQTTELKELDKEFNNPAFNLTISCPEFPKFKTELNIWSPGPNNPRNGTFWDSEISVEASVDRKLISSVEVQGAMTIDYMGFSLSPSGLVKEHYGAACEKNLETICEHQSCYTIEGNECVFPFYL